MLKSIEILVLALVVLAGCATSPKETEAKLEGSTEICCVCRYNNDLACLKVKVTEATPRADMREGRFVFAARIAEGRS